MVQHADIDHTGVTGVSGNVAADTIWDAKGDLAVGTGANTAAKLTVGANDKILMADSGETTGLKWVASQTPTTQDYDDVAAEGTADTFARGDHLHGMPSAAASGGLLAAKAYGPSGDNTYVISTSSDADVDGTNLTLAFTAPASGNVVVKLSALYNDSTSGTCNMHWTVRESTTTLADAYMSSGLAKAVRGNASLYISGISAGSHTYKFGAYQTGGTNSTIYYGTTTPFGKIMIEIWAAP